VEGAGAPAQRAGGDLVLVAGAHLVRARVGEVLRRRPRPPAVPQTLFHRPNISVVGLPQVQLLLDVRHRHQ
ncbi:unnamed protein product, partial [Linum tenue]